jgi:FkbM family methyltransferase
MPETRADPCATARDQLQSLRAFFVFRAWRSWHHGPLQVGKPSMPLSRFSEMLRRRRRRRDYRAMVKLWYADGGDDRFRFDYDLDERSLVVDLGGYEGQWASDLYARQRCRIAIFEPVARFARNIEARFRKNKDITVFACGLGASSRTETIYVHGASSSTHKKQAQSEQIELVDVQQWFEEHGIESVQLMKINIEGGEYELLERLVETGLIAKIDDIQVQFHNFTADAAARMERLQRAMRATHTPTYQYRFVWENWRRNRTVSS